MKHFSPAELEAAEARKMALWNAGKSNREIARLLGLDPSTISRWRSKRGLPSRTGRGVPHPPEIRAKVEALLLTGKATRQVAEALGLTKSYVSDVRKKMAPDDRLLPHGGQRGCRMAKDNPLSPFTDALYARIAAAVPYGIPADLRDDIISEVYVAILEGELAEADIERTMSKSIGKGYSRHASMFGPLSLDQQRGSDDDGFTLMQFVADPRTDFEFDLALHRGLEARRAALSA